MQRTLHQRLDPTVAGHGSTCLRGSIAMFSVDDFEAGQVDGRGYRCPAYLPDRPHQHGYDQAEACRFERASQ